MVTKYQTCAFPIGIPTGEVSSLTSPIEIRFERLKWLPILIILAGILRADGFGHCIFKSIFPPFFYRWDGQLTNAQELNTTANYHAIDWTPLRAMGLTEFYNYAPLEMQCQSGSGKLLPYAYHHNPLLNTNHI